MGHTTTKRSPFEWGLLRGLNILFLKIFKKWHWKQTNQQTPQPNNPQSVFYKWKFRFKWNALQKFLFFFLLLFPPIPPKQEHNPSFQSGRNKGITGKVPVIDLWILPSIPTWNLKLTPWPQPWQRSHLLLGRWSPLTQK